MDHDFLFYRPLYCSLRGGDHRPAGNAGPPEQATETGCGDIGVDSREFHLFRSLDLENKGEITVSALLDSLLSVGLNPDDARLAETTRKLDKLSLRDKLSYAQFCDLVRPNILLVDQALQGNMVIPDFAQFCEKLQEIFSTTKRNRDGKVADYIPQLARVDPELYGVSLYTVDGQWHAAGDSNANER